MEVAYSIAWYIIFILSATIHEAAHAWVAKQKGDLTAYAGGQVSLNPLPHIEREPFGMVVLPLISTFLIGWPFGYASTPYDPIWAYNHPRRAALMAAAGPVANLLLVILCAITVKLGILGGIFAEPNSVGLRHIVDAGSGGLWTGLSIFISMLFNMNLIMVVLNLIPFPPLDGSNIISIFLHDTTARSYRKVVSNPVFAFVGLFLAWQLFDPFFDVVFLRVINIIYWGANFY